MENLLGQAETIKNAGTFYLPNDVDRTLLTVATRDIAGTAARALLDESWTGQHSIPVVEPDNLSPRQMAEIVSDVVGRPVRAEHVPAEEYKTTLTSYGLNPGLVQGLINMAAAQDDGTTTTTPPEPAAPPPASNSGVATPSFTNPALPLAVGLGNQAACFERRKVADGLRSSVKGAVPFGFDAPYLFPSGHVAGCDSEHRLDKGQAAS